MRAAKNDRRRTFDGINNKRPGTTGYSSREAREAREAGLTRGSQEPQFHVPSKTNISPFSFSGSERPMTTGGRDRNAGANTNASVGTSTRSVLRPNKSGNRHLPPAMRLDRSMLR